MATENLFFTPKNLFFTSPLSLSDLVETKSSLLVCQIGFLFFSCLIVVTENTGGGEKGIYFAVLLLTDRFYLVTGKLVMAIEVATKKEK